MADDLPDYKTWLRTQPCACAPCVASVIVHHHTSAPTHAPGVSPAKSLGGKRGKGQRASDYYGIPLCLRHHGQLHALSGFFKHVSGRSLRDWQDTQVTLHRDRYERIPSNVITEFQRLAPNAFGDFGDVENEPEQETDWTRGANAERASIARWIRTMAGEARHAPDVAAALHDIAEALDECAAPFTADPTIQTSVA